MSYSDKPYRAVTIWAFATVLLLSLTTISAHSSPIDTDVSSDGEQSLSVDAANQVTDNPSPARSHTEPAIAIHPQNSDVVALLEGDGSSSACGVHISSNSGRSWETAANPQPDSHPRCMFSNNTSTGDIGFSDDGTLYVTFPGREHDQDPTSEIFVARSDDLGATWRTTMIPGLGQDFEGGVSGSYGEPVLGIDPEDPSNIYVSWRTNYRVTLPFFDSRVPVDDSEDKRTKYPGRAGLSWSTDGGETFSEPVDMGTGSRDPQVVIFDINIEVSSDGAPYVFMSELAFPEEGESDAPEAHMLLAKAPGPGGEFELSEIYSREGSKDWPFTWMGSIVPGIDRTNGTLYAAFEELGSKQLNVVVIKSSDGGETWSEPVVVNDVEPPLSSEWSLMYPTMDVSPNGRIDVAWYDPRTDPTLTGDETSDEDVKFEDIYYAYSADGGESWSEDVRISDRTMDRRMGIKNSGVHGPPAVGSFSDGAIIAWEDSRNSRSEHGTQDIYEAGVRFNEGEDGMALTGERMAWVSLGGGGGLFIGGMVLLVGLLFWSKHRRSLGAEGLP